MRVQTALSQLPRTVQMRGSSVILQQRFLHLFSGRCWYAAAYERESRTVIGLAGLDDGTLIFEFGMSDLTDPEIVLDKWFQPATMSELSAANTLRVLPNR